MWLWGLVNFFLITFLPFFFIFIWFTYLFTDDDTVFLLGFDGNTEHFYFSFYFKFSFYKSHKRNRERRKKKLFLKDEHTISH